MKRKTLTCLGLLLICVIGSGIFREAVPYEVWIFSNTAIGSVGNMLAWVKENFEMLLVMAGIVYLLLLIKGLLHFACVRYLLGLGITLYLLNHFGISPNYIVSTIERIDWKELLALGRSLLWLVLGISGLVLLMASLLDLLHSLVLERPDKTIGRILLKALFALGHAIVSVFAMLTLQAETDPPTEEHGTSPFSEHSLSKFKLEYPDDIL